MTHTATLFTDHPRSRGVYSSREAAPAPDGGSSPLARGLLEEIVRHPRYRGIIPARAGFTTQGQESCPQRPDHPRSRGVYEIIIENRDAHLGSSPLARGLQTGEVEPSVRTRIIPARAGFTSRLNAFGTSDTDHPRSRGVYMGNPLRLALSGGSSPLARGLLTAQWVNNKWFRIIPARAGFTPAPPNGAFQAPDHPRSRGVYQRVGDLGAERDGSSPLARGLLGVPYVWGGSSRIIPARAGFTRGARPSPSAGADHPRSRGVYANRALTVAPIVGSSPLARGLHIRTRQAWRSERIIPARAGFTPATPPASDQQQDHPRSRGVYHV